MMAFIRRDSSALSVDSYECHHKTQMLKHAYSCAGWASIICSSIPIGYPVDVAVLITTHNIFL